MDFNTLFKVGKTLVNEYIVKSEDTADFIGNKGVITLSTPSMIRFIEDTANHIVVDNMPQNYRSVGTKINVEHINPTSINTKVTVKATLVAIEGRKLSYTVEVFNEKCKIGFGIYEQHIINLGNFLNKH
ncbi:dihydrolipoamide acyltransferase [Clostridium estertheticum]|uniref:thioesterase family protein n=1 Tax=Clostridium estertheticum TaxID=238834 RepID=UPI001C0D2E58|nr:hotdog domain-containing protein [Clostridium estertheticum]MBU3217277.1 dihydrolipoamide acyltransferase [Clostridium estertheticum]WAG55782.1 dihydrolipoamide acyltransferase [Clostridium estertheticum]